jgi:NAD(P)-dependent dehydrogenase (short-subunit alcohol dehydrogenase family)
MSAMEMDVSKAESIRAVAEEAIARLPSLNIIVNNAGV